MIERIPILRNLTGRAPVVGVVRLSGVVGQAAPVRRGITLAGLSDVLDKAFGLRGLKAVALLVNSPGGSPVQSSLICQRIRALAREKDVPVIAFAEDVAASGGYWLALAGDEIFADDNSIVGSIGVISSGFGLAGLIGKMGVERRIYTAGDKKSLLDPFLDEKQADVKRLKALQAEVHQSFQAAVRQRRGGRLKGGDDTLFSGEFWSGRRALELGLVDGIGEMRAVMRERFGDDVRFRLVGARTPWWRFGLGRLPGARVEAGAGAWADQLLAAVEERALWNRFGL